MLLTVLEILIQVLQKMADSLITVRVMIRKIHFLFFIQLILELQHILVSLFNKSHILRLLLCILRLAVP